MKTFHKHERMSLKDSVIAFHQGISRRLRTVEAIVVTARSIALVTFVSLSGLSVASEAQLAPEWIGRVSVGTALTAGIAGIHVEPVGVSYVTGTSGSSPNTDITTASFAADGSLRWRQTWNSTGNGADQASGITMGQIGRAHV